MTRTNCGTGVGQRRIERGVDADKVEEQALVRDSRDFAGAVPLGQARGESSPRATSRGKHLQVDWRLDLPVMMVKAAWVCKAAG